jgi:hypothetical protein
VDFVVVGLGLGALSVLLGVVMLGWLAPRAQRAAARTASPDDAARDLAVAAEQRGTGHAFLYAGAAMLLATTGGLAGALDDRTGALLVTTTATVAAIGILLGGYLHRARNPVPRRRMPAPVAEPTAPVADRPVSDSFIVTDVASGAAETLKNSLDDNGDARFDSFPPLGPVLEATVAGDNAPFARADRGPASGEVEPERVGDGPVFAPPGPESELIPDPADGDRDDAAPAEEEEAVVVGYVVPAARASGSPSPPKRRGAGEDPA